VIMPSSDDAWERRGGNKGGLGQSRDNFGTARPPQDRVFFNTMVQVPLLMFLFNNHRSAGPMARRLTTNQEIAGSIPASINIRLLLSEGDSILPIVHAVHGEHVHGTAATRYSL
jgi:hypothetical protein